MRVEDMVKDRLNAVMAGNNPFSFRHVIENRYFDYDIASESDGVYDVVVLEDRSGDLNGTVRFSVEKSIAEEQGLGTAISNMLYGMRRSA